MAELNDFVRAVARNFRHLNTGDIRVILVHAGELIFPELPRSLAEFAQRLLSKRGMEVRLRTRFAGPRPRLHSSRAGNASLRGQS